MATEPPADTTDGADAADAAEQEQVKHDIAGFDKANLNGFFVQSRNEEFRLNIGAYAQVRYNLVWRETPPAGDPKFDSGFVVARARFFFEGKMTDRIEYQLRFNIDDAGDFSLLIAYAGYNFKDYHHRSAHNHGAWNLRVGRQFVAITREDWMFPQDLLTTEFSAVDQAFAVGTSDGLQAFYGRDLGRVWFALSNGAAGGKEDFPDNTTSQALLSGRGEVQLLGDDWNVFNDLVGRRGRPLGVLLGVGSGYAVTRPQCGRFYSSALRASHRRPQRGRRRLSGHGVWNVELGGRWRGPVDLGARGHRRATSSSNPGRSTLSTRSSIRARLRG